VLENESEVDVRSSSGISLDLLSSSNQNTNSDMKEDISKARRTLQNKLKWATCKLETCLAVDCCIQLCSLIKECSDTLKSLKSLENDFTTSSNT